MVASSRLAELRPKSSLTLRSAPPCVLSDSDVDLPRNSHREVRAKPCCGSEDVAWLGGGGPKTFFS